MNFLDLIAAAFRHNEPGGLVEAQDAVSGVMHLRLVPADNLVPVPNTGPQDTPGAPEDYEPDQSESPAPVPGELERAELEDPAGGWGPVRVVRLVQPGSGLPLRERPLPGSCTDRPDDRPAGPGGYPAVRAWRPAPANADRPDRPSQGWKPGE